jgi:outer membrane protein assembly factor BamB
LAEVDLKRRWILIAITVVAVLGVSATAGAIILFPPQRVEVAIAGPALPVALRPGAWTVAIRNVGPNIGDLGLRLGGRDGWMAQHSIVSTTGECRQPARDDLLLCGPIRQGETKIVSVIAAPKAAGSYSYEASFCDCSQGRQIALLGPGSPRFTIPGSSPMRYAQTWTEVVLPEPTAAITVTDIYGVALSGASVLVSGSSVSAITASTGVARLGLGPLVPGTHTVVAIDAGYIDTGAQITVADSGDSPAVSIQMVVAAPHLAPGSDPGVLPGPLLVADEDNNRLVEISPAGQVLWQFPRPGDLAPGQTFEKPDDAFFSPDGTQIIATQEENFAVTLVDVATHKIVWRYGQPGVHGSGPNQLWNPDDAMVLPNGDVVISDIVNCRLIVVAKGDHTVARSYGRVGSCYHNPPLRFGSPNGAFPLQNGNWLVTEINRDWVSEIAPGGTVLWSTHPPGVAYPSDTNEIGPNRYLTADYSFPGQVVIFDRSGRTLWRYRPTGAAALNHPSLAVGLPNGDVMLNDDANHRVIVVDPRTSQVVWQYGVTGRPGSTLGLLNNPDGVDLAPPYSLLGTHAATLRPL